MLHPCAKMLGAEMPISGPKWGYIHGAVLLAALRPRTPCQGSSAAPRAPSHRGPPHTPPGPAPGPATLMHTRARSHPRTLRPPLPTHTHSPLPQEAAAAHGACALLRGPQLPGATSSPGRVLPASFLASPLPLPAPGPCPLSPRSRVAHRHHLAAGFAQKASSFRRPLPCPGSRRLVQTKHFHTSAVPNARGFPAPCPSHRNVPDEAGTCGRAAPGAPCRAAARPRSPLKITQPQLLPAVS